MPKHGKESKFGPKRHINILPDRITGIIKRKSGIPASCLVLAKYLEKGSIIQDAIINYLNEKKMEPSENFGKLMKLNGQNCHIKGNRKYLIRLAILSPPSKKDVEILRANARKYANDLKASAEKIGILITEFQEANRLKAEAKAKADAEKDKRIEAMMLVFFNTANSDIKDIINNKDDKNYLLFLSAARMCAKHGMNPGGILNINEIGNGAYGTVYRVQYGDLVYACKIIRKIKGKNDEKNEAEIMRVVQNGDNQYKEYVVSQLDEPFENKDYVCLTIELCEGGDLHTRLKKSVSFNQAFQYMTEILRAMKVLRHHRIIHGDIKPSNILLGKNGKIKISDFGLSIVDRNQLKRFHIYSRI